MLKNFVFIIMFVPYFEETFDLSDQWRKTGGGKYQTSMHEAAVEFSTF